MFKLVCVFLLISVVLFSSGCSTLGKIVDVGGEVNDNALVTSEVTICRAASVGAVLRRYNTPEKAKAWLTLCTYDNDAPLVIFSAKE